MNCSCRVTAYPEINGSRHWLSIPVAFPMKLCHSSCW
jgi:hypothetical protein